MGIAFLEHMRNEEVRRSAGLECISEMIMTAMLRGYETVVSNDEEYPISIVCGEQRRREVDRMED